MSSTPFVGASFRQTVQAGKFPSGILPAQVACPTINPALYGRMIGLGLNENGTNLVSSLPLQVPALNVTSGKINGLNLSSMVTSIQHLNKIADVDELVEYWDSNKVGDFYTFDNSYVNTSKTSVIKSRWSDDNGIVYGLIETSYNLDLGLGDETQLFANYMISRTVPVLTYTEVVVIGITFDKLISNIYIPYAVAVDTKDASGNVTETTYYPVREIWGADIYASVKSGVRHVLSLKELSNPSLIDYVPAVLYAPFITKISLKRRLSTTYSAFSGVCARSIYMPNLVSLVGASRTLPSPAFCSLNDNKFHLERLCLPSLKKIKNCMFACNCLSVDDVCLPALEELDEVIFLRGDILLKEMELPKLQSIKGCNYFLANCYNLEKLVLPTYVKFMPHDPVKVTITNDASSLLRGTLTLLGLDSITITATGNAAMQYFLHADTKLMNAVYTGNTGESQYAPPYDQADVDVAYGRGIFFLTQANDYGYWWYKSTSLQDKDHMYGSCIETFNQWARRVGYTGTAAFNTDPTFEVSNGNKTYMYFVETETGLLVVSNGNESEPLGGDNMMCPIDPRTALFNTNNLANEQRNTAVHSYTDEEPVIRFVENSSFHDYSTTFGERRKVLIVMLGLNQYYHVSGADAF